MAQQLFRVVLDSVSRLLVWLFLAMVLVIGVRMRLFGRVSGLTFLAGMVVSCLIRLVSVLRLVVRCVCLVGLTWSCVRLVKRLRAVLLTATGVTNGVVVGCGVEYERSLNCLNLLFLVSGGLGSRPIVPLC